MNIEYLDEFAKVASCKSITEAAKLCHMTQSALSKHIQAMEAELGASLFVRDQVPIEVTEAGRILFESAMSITESYHQAAKRIAQLPHAGRQSVRVGGMFHGPVVRGAFRQALGALGQQGRAPGLSVSFRDIPDQPALDALADGRLDAVVQALPDPEHIDGRMQARFLFFDPYYAIVSKTNPLARKQSVSLDDLRHVVKVVPLGSNLIGSNVALNRMLASTVLSRAWLQGNAVRTVFVESIYDFAIVDVGMDVMLLSRSMVEGNFYPGNCVALPVSDDNVGMGMYFVMRTAESREHIKQLADALAEAAKEATS